MQQQEEDQKTQKDRTSCWPAGAGMSTAKDMIYCFVHSSSSSGSKILEEDVEPQNRNFEGDNLVDDAYPHFGYLQNLFSSFLGV